MNTIVKPILSSLIIFSMFLTACHSGNNKEKMSNEENSTINQNSNQEVTESKSNNEESQNATADNNRVVPNKEANNIGDTKIKLTFHDEEVIVRMLDNPTSNAFLELLPLTLTFEDYAGTEKISYPPSELSTEGAPSGIDPAAGDFTYYAPWGNLAIFYQDFGHSNGLIKLGEFESGIEKLENLDGDFEMVIEIID
ncbi:hypothetical protein J14TS2_49780 [Bacillus sp. J14TS2]|uniref:cyclophilin-like fold protein n=1 Tax=Bacillus sp. J14TS2 TaxID=2807188 RepID=UPI001B0930D4|nr:cyclophilin-like fold protein [Bacillus sp. J14TS2]GIN74503.1 hypothetical protein J14TS2_49780 [Bacillus sp. J14TS2]